MKHINKLFILLLVLTSILIAQDSRGSSQNNIVLNKDDYHISGIHKKLNLSCKDCHLEKNESDYSSQMNTACFNCHGSYDKLKESTSYLGHNNNIHAAPHFNGLDCDMCHKAHQPTVNFCVSCHGQETMKSLLVK